MFANWAVLGLCLTSSAVLAQAPARLELGRLTTGGTVTFVRHDTGDWGVEIKGGASPTLQQPKPARLEVSGADSEIEQLAAGYKTVQKSEAGIVAQAEVPYAQAVLFRVSDTWTLSGAVLCVRRKVDVQGNAPGGFYSSVLFTVDSDVNWSNVNCLAPGALYGDPTYNGERSPGGTLNYAAKRFLMREDILPAPLFGLSFANGSSVTVLDPSPRGDTTVAETRLSQPVMTDSRFQFGALGAWQSNDGPIEFGFWFPGTASMYGGATNSAAQPRWNRRYHPIAQGVAHSYQVSFRFGQNESFRDLTRNTWRWAWNTLQPVVRPIDVEQMRRVLIDHLAAQAATIDGRTAIPFVISTVPTNQLQWNWSMVAMGFVGKNIECADQLLREAERDHSERGQKMRQTGLAIIASIIQALPTVPLQGTGYDLATGKPWDHIWVAPWLRNATEDMRVLIRAYRRERNLGRKHPEWFYWVKSYVDWLLGQQRADGSFPRRWKPGSNEVAEPTGTTSYCPVPLLVMLSEETGDPRYRQAAIRAADYVWQNWGRRGLFIGGASDNPNITDKEAGMLSMEAYLSLYDSTHEPKWLERAQAAADFAESWIWIWNLPMPLDADDAHLHWKRGVPTVGVQGITARVAGSVDEYLDWAVPSYAKLYNLTKDPHYLEVARILLHDTKSMVALPGRQYDLKGIGWQQEGWRMGPGGAGRGVGGHRFWLPWISANHLYGITGLEEYDPSNCAHLNVRTSVIIHVVHQSINPMMKRYLYLVIYTALLSPVLRGAEPESIDGFRDGPLLPGSKWRLHDADRPQPPGVTPGATFSQLAPPPSDAEVLFDGKDLSKWQNARGQEAPWVVKDGFMETAAQQGIRTKGKWADFQLHVEFATPNPPKGTGQGRGNSGVLINGMYEVQILDSYRAKTYPDGQCGAIYGQSPPLVNASKPPGEWQTYDIIFESPRWNEQGELTKKAVITVLHNGVVVQNHYEFTGITDGISRQVPWRTLSRYATAHPPEVFIELQYHNNPVRFRNIWIRKLGRGDQT